MLFFIVLQSIEVNTVGQVCWGLIELLITSNSKFNSFAFHCSFYGFTITFSTSSSTGLLIYYRSRDL